MNFDSEGLEVLSRSECIELIRSVPIGRIVFTHQALPAIRPVSFSVVDGTVVIPTRSGSNLATAAQGAVVAFQADAFDAGGSSGWSVTVVGHAEVIHTHRADGDTGTHADGFAAGLRRDTAGSKILADGCVPYGHAGAAGSNHRGSGAGRQALTGAITARALGDGADPDPHAPRTRCERDGFIRIALDQVSGRRMPAH